MMVRFNERHMILLSLLPARCMPSPCDVIVKKKIPAKQPVLGASKQGIPYVQAAQKPHLFSSAQWDRPLYLAGIQLHFAGVIGVLEDECSREKSATKS
jgi:hypothetical protein